MPRPRGAQRLYLAMFPRMWTWTLIAEFAVYGLVLVWAYSTVGVPFWTTELNRVCEAEPRCIQELKPDRSLLPGGRVDQSDGQTREFRSNLHLIVAAGAALSLIGRFVRAFVAPVIDPFLAGPTARVSPSSTAGSIDAPPVSAEAIAALPLSPTMVGWFVAAGALYAWQVAGSDSLAILAVIVVQWALTRAVITAARALNSTTSSSSSSLWLLRVAGPLVAWAWAFGVKMAAEPYRHTAIFRPVAATLAMGLDPWLADHVNNAGDWLERHRTGVRWWALYGLALLRLISWSIDTLWAAQRDRTSDSDRTNDSDRIRDSDRTSDGRPTDVDTRKAVTSSNDGDGPTGYAARTLVSHSSRDHSSLIALVAYVAHPPGLVAGPVSSFNAWLSHLKQPTSLYSLPSLLIMAARTAAIVGLHEVVISFVPFHAVAKHGAYRMLDPVGLAVFGYTAVVMIWLKFLMIWRIFRLWALADGFEVPENMRRCVSNNYSLIEFWRSWHRSFNLWIVRYIFIPIGGSRSGLLRTIVNTSVVFVFVALWHDVDWKLLIWGWAIGLLFAPELGARALVAPGSGKLAWVREQPWFRHVVALGAAANIAFMITVNVIGYTALGGEGTRKLLADLLDKGGISVVLASTAALFCAGQVMLLIRAGEEAAHGAVKEDWRGEFPPQAPSDDDADHDSEAALDHGLPSAGSVTETDAGRRRTARASSEAPLH